MFLPPSELPRFPPKLSQAQRKADGCLQHGDDAVCAAFILFSSIICLLQCLPCGVCRYRLFAEPPMLDDEEGIHALQCLSCPMDLLTMLYKVRDYAIFVHGEIALHDLLCSFCSFNGVLSEHNRGWCSIGRA